MTSFRRISLGFLALAAFPLVAGAQLTGASIDLGGLTMRYADSVDATALALTPAFWAESSLTSFALAGTLSQFASDGWSAQGAAAGSVFTRRIGSLLGELEGASGGSAHNDGSRTGQILATARAHFAGAERGVWAGGGLGRTWDGFTWRSVRQGEAGAWTSMGAVTALASVTPVVVDDSVRYTDAQLSAGVNLRHFELTASGGFRGGGRLPTLGGTAKSWGSASVTGWIGSRIAIVASAGTYPVDLTQGFPGGRFASLSVRLGARRFAPSLSQVSQVSLVDGIPPASGAGPSTATVFELRNVGGGAREIRVLAPSASSVELMGDFTDWAPVRLTLGGEGWWSVRLPIAVGIHEINLRIDGGAWITPPGLMSRSDEFGGSVGLLVVR